MRTRSSMYLSIATTLFAAVATSACGHDQPPPQAPSDQLAYTQTTNAVVAPTPEPAQQPAAIQLGPNLRQACGIDDTDRAPKFAFDQASITSTDQDIAAAVAQCMTQGPLQGKSLSLVGRADPRGTEDYNMRLGERRADAFRDALVQKGVDTSRLQQSSRGALDAQGTDESSWQRDRRVDVELAQ